MRYIQKHTVITNRRHPIFSDLLQLSFLPTSILSSDLTFEVIQPFLSHAILQVFESLCQESIPDIWSGFDDVELYFENCEHIKYSHFLTFFNVFVG